MLAQRIQDSLRLRKRGDLSIPNDQMMHLDASEASPRERLLLCANIPKSTTAINNFHFSEKDEGIVTRTVGNTLALSIDTNSAAISNSSSIAVVRPVTLERTPVSMSTRRRISARYRRLMTFLRASHERLTSLSRHDLTEKKSTPVSSSIFSLPSGLESSDFLLLPHASTAPQHHYPTPEMLSRSPRSGRTGTHVWRSYSPLMSKSGKHKSEFPHTPYAFYKLLATPSTHLPCSEYLSIYVPLVTTLTAQARQKVEIKRRKQYSFSYCNINPMDRYESSSTSSSGTQPAVNISLCSEDHEDGDVENGYPCVLGDENVGRYSGNGKIGSKCTSYSGFYNPPTLRFVGGCRTFSEYLRDFCAWIASHGNENDNAPGIREDEVEELLRTVCAPPLLRSMALMEGRKEDYYYTSGIKSPKYSWLGYNTNALKNRNGNTSGRRKRELAKGIGVSYTADRNYIWRKRAEVIFNPDIVLREEHEIMEDHNDVSIGCLERTVVEQLDQLGSFEQTGTENETSLLFREFVDSVFSDSESNMDLADLTDHMPLVNVNVRELDSDDCSKHEEEAYDVLGTVFHNDVIMSPRTKFQSVMDRMWNYSLKKNSR
ncbi:uncharacterized protein V1513DRAFT_439756 [Lipomyces chichibuensis]|uniref:uncharacterized protein n=1 Tax=Lipomyces chichibuensis TaxID=1546026 RepID=UPI0033437F7F